MPPRPSSVLAAVAHHVPEALVPADALAACQRLAAVLPPAFNWIGFECRLRAGDDRVDFAGCCEAQDGGRTALDQALRGPTAFAGPEVRDLLTTWCRPGSDLHLYSPAVWLEFDFLGGGPPATFAFLCLDPACADAFHTPIQPQPRPPGERIQGMFAAGATLLAGRPPSMATLDLFARSVAALPATGRALHVAATPHRGHTDLRVHYALLAGELDSWLDALQWPGDRACARALVALLGDDFRQVGVQLNLGASVRPYLGLEAYVRRKPAEFAGWARLLSALGDACDPAKLQALLRWWGTETTTLPDAPWRVAIKRQFYVKFVLGPEGLEAKAYLCIMPRYVLL